MSAARTEPFPRPKPTQTIWPASRRPEPPVAKPPQETTPRDDEHPGPSHDEPGYGHGV